MARRCTDPGDHHSDDLVSVYHGLADPTIVCGYHASIRFPSGAGRVWHRPQPSTETPKEAPTVGAV